MLSKHAESRPTAAETAQQLEGIRASLNARGWLPAIRAATTKKVALSAVAALGLTAAALVFIPRQPRAAVDLSRMNVRPMASQPGLETNPALSPDGAWLACLYRLRSTDRPQLQVHATRGGAPAVLDTGDLVVEESASWAPDSHDLAFVGRDGLGKRAIYRIARTGGATSKLAECLSSCDFDWAPDGRSLALIEILPGQQTNELVLVEPGTVQSRRRLLHPSQWILTPRFSPDGKWLAFVRLTSYTSHDLCMLPSSGGPVHCVTRRPGTLDGYGWSSDSRSLVAMSGRRGDRPQMWQFPADGQSEPVRVASFDFGRARGLSIARSKGSMAWLRDMSTESVWRMPVSGADAATQRIKTQRVVSSASMDTDAEWSRQGRLVFRSDRSGSNEIWLARGDGSAQVQATRFRGPFVGDAHWSPDGRHLAFTAHAGGNADIFTVPCDSDGPEPCGTLKQITRSPATDVNPTWSSDGSSVYFSSDRTGSFELWRIGTDGGQPVRITQQGGYLARESTDGKWLYYSKLARNGIWRLPLPFAAGIPKEQAVVPAAPAEAAATWTLGSHVLFYYPSEAVTRDRNPSIRSVDLDTSRVRDLDMGDKMLGRGLSLSPDGKSLLHTTKDRVSSSIVIAE